MAHSGAQTRLVGFVALITLVAAACGADEDGSRSSTDPTPAQDLGSPTAEVERSDETSYLFAAQGGATIDDGRLSLARVTHTTYISDHPMRDAGQLPAEHLVLAWASFGFTDDPPNAVLVGDQRSIPVELRSPQWDGDTNTMSLAVAGLGSTQLPEGSIGAAELFIDDTTGCQGNSGAYFWNLTLTTTDGLDCRDVGYTMDEEVLSDFDDGGALSSVELGGRNWTCNSPSTSSYCNAGDGNSLAIVLTYDSTYYEYGG